MPSNSLTGEDCFLPALALFHIQTRLKSSDVALTFESVKTILKCDYLNESYLSS